MDGLRFNCCLLLLLLAALSGCGNDSEQESVELPDWLAEVEGTADPTAAAEPSPSRQSVADEGGGQSGGLRLATNQRFPLRRVVEQELTQSSVDGHPQVSRTRLEMFLAISVAEVRPDRTLLQVQYDRVKYSHEIGEDRAEFDSHQPGTAVPAAALPYKGMIGDGFGFWIDVDNQIVAVEGLEEFIGRCLTSVPAEQQQQAMQLIRSQAGKSGIGRFVDPAIGLLHTQPKSPGESWEHSEHVSGPVPMQIQTVYTLSDLNEETAEVTIAGAILPSTVLRTSGAPSSGIRVAVTGGRNTGRCIIDRRTGLPREADVEQLVDMVVRMEGGIEFRQQKRTRMLIESLASPQLAAEAGPPRRFQ
jgi:hypothetical protein